MATVIDELITVLGFKADLRGLERANQRINEYKRGLDSLARNMGFLGAALTGTGVAIGKTVLDFDRAQNTLAGVFLDVPTEELNRLREQALELGATTSKSARDAANAQVELARSGLDVQQVYESIPHVLNLAIAGELEMGEAAGLVTNQLAAFKVETSETERVVDVLVKTANSARTTVAELGPAFRQVAPLAAGLGVSFEETAAALGTLRTRGLIPEQAGTALRNILAIFQEEPSARVQEGFNKLGVSFEQVQAMVSGGDLLGALKLLGDAGLDTGTALAIFGRESAIGATILAGSVSDVDSFKQALLDVDGTAKEVREIIDSGLPGSVAEFKSALGGVQLALGDSGLRGVMIRVLNVLRDGLSLIADAPGPLKTLTTVVIAAGPVLLGLAAAAKIVSFALGGLTVIVRAATGIAWLWRNALIATRVQLALLTFRTWAANAAQIGMRGVMLLGAAATGVATAATWAFNAALWANPLGLIILGIVAALAALGGAIFLIIKHWDWVKAKAQAVWDFILGAVQSVWNWISQKWPTILAIITGPVGLAVSAFVKFKDDIIGVFASVKDFIIGVWQSIWDFIMGIINRIKNAPADLLESLPGGKFVQKAVAALPGFAAGGVVPGPVGQAQAAIVHGGEMVLPQPFAENLRRLLDGGVSALVGPAPGMAMAGAGGGTVIHEDNRTFDFSIAEGAVVVHAAPGQDAAEIGEVVSQKLRAEIRAAYRAFDSNVQR